MTSARIAGHPIHPMIVPFPIGLWVFSLVADVVYRAGWGGPTWSAVAYYTMAGGLVGALLAAVPGLVDYLTLRSDRPRRIATIHLVLNLTIVALYAVNLWLRATRPDAMLPVWLSVVGVGLLVVSGWFGGELVYVLGVGVEPTDRGRLQPEIRAEEPRARTTA
jgi:uncharacterized membrane protein